MEPTTNLVISYRRSSHFDNVRKKDFVTSTLLELRLYEWIRGESSAVRLELAGREHTHGFFLWMKWDLNSLRGEWKPKVSRSPSWSSSWNPSWSSVTSNLRELRAHRTEPMRWWWRDSGWWRLESQSGIHHSIIIIFWTSSFFTLHHPISEMLLWKSTISENYEKICFFSTEWLRQFEGYDNYFNAIDVDWLLVIRVERQVRR